MSYTPLTPISQNHHVVADEFAGLPVTPFSKSLDTIANAAIRIAVNQEQNADPILYQLDDLAAHPKAADLHALVIGRWAEWSLGESSVELVTELAKMQAVFPQLNALFLGDIPTYETELAWLNHGDITPILDAFPDLTVFQVRGMGVQLESGVRHHHLQHVCYETVDQLHAGHSHDVVEAMVSGSYPNLRHLEVWQRSPAWRDVFSHQPFNHLHYAGLRHIPELAPFLTDVLRPAEHNHTALKVLDLSGALCDDDIATTLLNNTALLQQLDEIYLGPNEWSAALVKQFEGYQVALVHPPEDEYYYDDDYE